MDLTMTGPGPQGVHWSTTVTRELTGDRLDHVLKLACPGKSLRQVRRLWDQGRVLVNDLPCPKGHRVQAGDRISVKALEGLRESSDLQVEVVAEQGPWAALNKPSRVHTEGREGSSGPSLEDSLGALFPGRSAQLLNRLDYLTTGLVLVAFDRGAANRYHHFQDSGQVKKTYLARVHGLVHQTGTIRFKIRSAKRKKVQILKEETGDRLRWTEVFPLNVDNPSVQSLVRVRILKGIRHQIRAHLAAVGHPIVGDPVYGQDRVQLLHLHHHEVVFPGFRALVPPQEWTG